MSERAELRILVVSQLPPPVHGSTVMTGHLLGALERLGLRAQLVDRRFSRSVDEVGRAGLAKVLAVPSLVARLLASTTRRPAAAVYFVTNRPGSFLVDAVLVHLLRLRRVPVIHYVHTVGFGALAARGPLWRRFVTRALRAADRVVVLGDRLVDDVAAFVPHGRIEVVPNTAGSGAGDRIEDVERGRAVEVLFLSNLLPEKGVDDFVEVASRLVELHDGDWRFRIAGAGGADRLADLRADITRRGLDGRIELVGAVQADAKWALLRRAAVLVFPSRYPFEAQPLTIVEALAVGTPVVAYDVGGIGDVVDERVGALVPPGDLSAMADAILDLERDGTLHGGRRPAIRAHYDRTHSADAYRTRWRRVLEEATQ